MTAALITQVGKPEGSGIEPSSRNGFWPPKSWNGRNRNCFGAPYHLAGPEAVQNAQRSSAEPGRGASTSRDRCGELCTHGAHERLRSP
jgi:hypothetical protein